MCLPEMISRSCQRKAEELEENPIEVTSAHLFSYFFAALTQLNKNFLTHAGLSCGVYCFLVLSQGILIIFTKKKKHFRCFKLDKKLF